MVWTNLNGYASAFAEWWKQKIIIQLSLNRIVCSNGRLKSRSFLLASLSVFLADHISMRYKIVWGYICSLLKSNVNQIQTANLNRNFFLEAVSQWTIYNFGRCLECRFKSKNIERYAVDRTVAINQIEGTLPQLSCRPIRSRSRKNPTKPLLFDRLLFFKIMKPILRWRKVFDSN